jgi:hypothetical protein
LTARVRGIKVGRSEVKRCGSGLGSGREDKGDDTVADGW